MEEERWQETTRVAQQEFGTGNRGNVACLVVAREGLKV